MRSTLLIILMAFMAMPAIAEEAIPNMDAEEEVVMPDFDAQRKKLREDYLKLKAEMEQDYTQRIKAINPGPTDLTLQMEKRELEQEYRQRKQTVLDDYQEQVRILRDEEATLKGELDRYYYEEKVEEDPKFKPRPMREKVKPKAKEEEEVRRGSRTIPPFEGRSAIGTNPKNKSKGRSGGLVKSKKRAKQLKKKKESQSNESSKQKRGGINNPRSIFDKNRR